MITIQNLKAIKETIFQEVIPKNYWGAVGGLICRAIRESEDIFEAFTAIRNCPIDSEAYHHLAKLSDNQLRQCVAYFWEREKLSKAEKKRLNQGSKYPQLPDFLPPKTQEGWVKLYLELKRIQKARDYKSGWLFYQLKRVNAPEYIFILYKKENTGRYV